MDTLTIELVVGINRSLGAGGVVVNPGNLDFLVKSATTVLDPTKAAAGLLFDIITFHPFLDGNKRTAVVLMESYLEFHGLKLSASDAELEKLVYEIAIGKYTKKEVEGAIKKKLS
jgi:death-on-curing family protein